MLAVHLGPGALGLGLIVEQLHESGFDVCLVGRPDVVAPDLAEFGLACADPDIGLTYQAVRWVTNAAAYEDLPSDVVALISNEPAVLVTAALGADADKRAELIRAILSHRPAGSETVLLACENEPADTYGEIADSFAASAHFPATVVDRICSRPEESPVDELGRRIVRMHPVGEWVIQAQPTPLTTLNDLARAATVAIVSEPLEGYYFRKLWAVNGVHLMLALTARQAGVSELPLGDAEHVGVFVALASPLIDQVSRAVAYRWPAIRPTPDYAPDRIRAFLESEDTTRRILRGRLLRDDLRPFMQRLETRVADAARAAHAAGCDCEPFYQAMALVLEVLKDPASYYASDGTVRGDSLPTNRRTDWTLSRAVDSAVVEQFAAALQPWCTDAAAAPLVAGLKRALRAHHALIKPEFPSPGAQA